MRKAEIALHPHPRPIAQKSPQKGGQDVYGVVHVLEEDADGDEACAEQEVLAGGAFGEGEVEGEDGGDVAREKEVFGDDGAARREELYEGLLKGDVADGRLEGDQAEAEDPEQVHAQVGLYGQQQPVGQGPQPGEAQQHAGIQEKEDDPGDVAARQRFQQRVGPAVARAGFDVAEEPMKKDGHGRQQSEAGQEQVPERGQAPTASPGFPQRTVRAHVHLTGDGLQHHAFHFG